MGYINNNNVFVVGLCLITGLILLPWNGTGQAPQGKDAIAKISLLPDNQAKIDSIINFTNQNRKRLNSETLFIEGLKIADKIGYKKGEAKLLDAYGVYNRDLSRYSEALELHRKSLDVAEDIGDVSAQMFALNNLGVVYRRLDENSSAINYHLRALKLAEETGHDYSASVSLNSIGNIHLALGNYLEAKNYFEQCLPIARKSNNTQGIAMNLNNIGEAFEALKQYDSAVVYYENSLFFNQQMNNDKGIAICYNSLGKVFSVQNKYDRAINLFENALEINKKLGDLLYTSTTFNNLGNLYLKQKAFQKANLMFDSALHISKHIRSKSEMKTAYDGLMRVNEGIGDFKKAYGFSTLSRLYADSLALDNNHRHIMQVEAIYKKAHEESKIAIMETQRRNDKIYIFGTILLAVLLLVSGALFFLRRRLIEHNKGLQRELKLRAQIASDLHDDMGSTLSSIHIFSELLRKSEGKAPGLLDKIEANAKDTLEALDDIIWLVNPSNDKFSNLGVHINEYAIPLFESKGIEVEIDFPDEVADLPLPMTTRRNIFLIMKESINNLVKYSDCTKAIIKATMEGETIRFLVKDNGKGFDPDKLTHRNGIKNIKSRAAQMGATLNLHSVLQEGTEMELTVPIKGKSTDSS